MKDMHQANREQFASGGRWYVVHTKPLEEGRAALHLERQGYPLFYPRFRKAVRHARRQTSTFLPLFPNYVFLQMNVSRDRWRNINGTHGVVRLLAQGDIPIPVPHDVIEALQARTGIDGVMDLAPAFHAGQMVRVAEGPFTDIVGTFQRLDAAGRVCVLLDLLGRSVAVTLPRETLNSAA